MANTPRYRYQMIAADKKAGSAPCKDCPDRYPACASNCQKYREWKRKRDYIRAEIMGAAKGQREAETALIEAQIRQKESLRKHYFPLKKDRMV